MGMGLWCLTPLSTILQLYRGGYCFNFLYSSLCKILDQHGLDLIDPGGVFICVNLNLVYKM